MTASQKNKAIRREPTKSEVEYQEATKNVRIATAKLRLTQYGVDVELLSRQNIDKAMNLFDEMDRISTETRSKISQIQNETNTEIQKINQRASEKYNDASKKIDELVKSLKKPEQTQTVDMQQAGQVVGTTIDSQAIKVVPEGEGSTVGTMPEINIRNEMANRITMLMEQQHRRSIERIRDSITDILKEFAIGDNLTIGKGVNILKEDIEKLHKEAKQMAIESTKIEPSEVPADKDIPVVTPEMMEKTEEEMTKREDK